ncbi:MAG TPA: hypothetical protein VGN16_26265 [Acidobacteriaceae bacterium]|jgi:hypothetical protein
MNNTTSKTTSNTDCKTCQAHMADLLLEPGYLAAHPELQAHMDGCDSCRTELAELNATMALLDEYTAPEPSPYFDTRLHARLREAQEAAPEGLWERMRSFLMFSTGRSFRPAVTAALALTLIAGGAGYVGINGGDLFHSGPAQASNTVNDLKVLDNNESAEQQMGQLLDQSGAEDDDAQSTT